MVTVEAPLKKKLKRKRRNCDPSAKPLAAEVGGLVSQRTDAVGSISTKVVSKKKKLKKKTTKAADLLSVVADCSLQPTEALSGTDSMMIAEPVGAFANIAESEAAAQEQGATVENVIGHDINLTDKTVQGAGDNAVGNAGAEEDDPVLTLEERRALKRKAKKARREAELTERYLKEKEDAFLSNENKVFVGGIEKEADAKKIFQKCGNLKSFSFPQNKGIAFITFTNEKGMRAALDLDGTSHKGRTINVKLAEHRGSKGKGGGKGKERRDGKGKGKGKRTDKGKGKGKFGGFGGHRVLA